MWKVLLLSGAEMILGEWEIMSYIGLESLKETHTVSLLYRSNLVYSFIHSELWASIMCQNLLLDMEIQRLVEYSKKKKKKEFGRHVGHRLKWIQLVDHLNFGREGREKQQK